MLEIFRCDCEGHTQETVAVGIDVAVSVVARASRLAKLDKLGRLICYLPRVSHRIKMGGNSLKVYVAQKKRTVLLSILVSVKPFAPASDFDSFPHYQTFSEIRFQPPGKWVCGHYWRDFYFLQMHWQY
nr:hypothetical protein CFP56_39225 [Quercus suber]